MTVMVNVLAEPVQSTPSLVAGVTVIIALMGELPLLAAVKDGISPVPLPAKPIAVLLFVHS